MTVRFLFLGCTAGLASAPGPPVDWQIAPRRDMGSQSIISLRRSSPGSCQIGLPHVLVDPCPYNLSRQGARRVDGDLPLKRATFNHRLSLRILCASLQPCRPCLISVLGRAPRPMACLSSRNGISCCFMNPGTGSGSPNREPQ
ncbi:hypothetical protein EDB80DRAFT_10848 [Ilyonectria destructans]|nr:hypothetical protein EDB80DRAFT_10848 [Ilyonectria destructans]